MSVDTQDVVKAVAEAKCPACQNGTQYYYIPSTSEEFIPGEKNRITRECPDCQGTGLRWPPLSQECPCIDGPTCCDACMSMDGDDYHGVWCEDCNGSGRVADVTLEKVLEIFVANGIGFDFDWYKDERRVNIDTGPKDFTGKSTTFELAACAALLTTIGE